jgi:hypothetical protein
MQISGMRKDIQELKKAALIEKKQAEDDWVKNLTDEELQEEINQDLAKLGFKSEEEFYESAKKYLAENGLKIEFCNDYVFQDYVSEQLLDHSKDYLEDFVKKYGNPELFK